MNLSSTRKGELCVLAAILVWCLFPIVSPLLYSSFSPIYAAGICSIIASLLFGFMLIQKKGWRQPADRGVWKSILGATLFNGFLYYVLYFTALKTTSPGNAALLAQLEILFSFLFLSLLIKHEPLDKQHLFGGVCMISSACIVIGPNMQSWLVSDVLIILAAAMAPIGNLFQQQARKFVTSEYILFWRSLLSGVMLLITALLFEGAPNLNLNQSSILLLLLNGIFIVGLSKIFWLEGIHRIRITKAISLGSAGPVLTLFFVWILLGDAPTIWQALAVAPLIIGIRLLTLSKEG